MTNLMSKCELLILKLLNIVPELVAWVNTNFIAYKALKHKILSAYWYTVFLSSCKLCNNMQVDTRLHPGPSQVQI